MMTAAIVTSASVSIRLVSCPTAVMVSRVALNCAVPDVMSAWMSAVT